MNQESAKASKASIGFDPELDVLDFAFEFLGARLAHPIICDAKG